MKFRGNAVNSDDFSSHVIADDLVPPAFCEQNGLARTKPYYIKRIERVPDTIQNSPFPQPCRHRQDSLTAGDRSRIGPCDQTEIGQIPSRTRWRAALEPVLASSLEALRIGPRKEIDLSLRSNRLLLARRQRSLEAFHMCEGLRQSQGCSIDGGSFVRAVQV
jgi:hypothetical protein